MAEVLLMIRCPNLEENNQTGEDFSEEAILETSWSLQSLDLEGEHEHEQHDVDHDHDVNVDDVDLEGEHEHEQPQDNR